VRATPFFNVIFLAIGALVANVPRHHRGFHAPHPAMAADEQVSDQQPIMSFFFIFIVSNVGGCLTPIGDPPLFWDILKEFPSGGWPVIAGRFGRSEWRCS
jgi:hypothetical protein